MTNKKEFSMQLTIKPKDPIFSLMIIMKKILEI